MNKDRRKLIDTAYATIESLIEDVQSIRDEEQEAFDNLSENLQQGERGQAMESAIGELDDAVNSLESARDSLENAKGE